MSIANDIISGRMPDFDHYLRLGDSLDDIDEYGFTPLIETAIAKQPEIAKALLSRGAAINKADVTGRTPLHWAVDNNDLEMSKLFLEYGADPNAYTRAGLSVLVYPVLRGQENLKHLLYQYGAKLDFALDFILAKLLGHRYELAGDIDIVNAKNEFVELDFEGFILEFTVAILKDSLRRFTSSYSTRHLRHYFQHFYTIMEGFTVASELLQLQKHPVFNQQQFMQLEALIQSPLLILPAASRGHAIGFIRYQNFWAKIDRGENAKKEGSVNIYQMNYPEKLNISFLQQFLYKKQPREFFHKEINKYLGLVPYKKINIPAQISGNCSWANIQAIVVVAYIILTEGQINTHDEALSIYQAWIEWDKDRALDEAIQRFYLANELRKVSICSMLATILYQSCDAANPQHLERAEKILRILTQEHYYYILETYLEEYCIKRLTRRGNNLLKILDDCGIHPNIGVTPIATGLDE